MVKIGLGNHQRLNHRLIHDADTSRSHRRLRHGEVAENDALAAALPFVDSEPRLQEGQVRLCDAFPGEANLSGSFSFTISHYVEEHKLRSCVAWIDHVNKHSSRLPSQAPIASWSKPWGYRDVVNRGITSLRTQHGILRLNYTTNTRRRLLAHDNEWVQLYQASPECSQLRPLQLIAIVIRSFVLRRKL